MISYWSRYLLWTFCGVESFTFQILELNPVTSYIGITVLTESNVVYLLRTKRQQRLQTAYEAVMKQSTVNVKGLRSFHHSFVFLCIFYV